MRTLLLIRHSKSDWSDSSITDKERPLNKRGRRDAPFMAHLIKSKGIIPDLFISSPAERAIQTAKYFAEEFNFDKLKIVIRDEIYSQGATNIRRILSQVDNSYCCVFLFGHNPDLTLLANNLSDTFVENIPTTGIVCIDFEFKSWQNILTQQGKMRFFEYPKKYLKKQS